MARFALIIAALAALSGTPSLHAGDLLDTISAPRPEGAETFDFLIGRWSCRFRIRELDGSITEGPCRWEARLAAGGHVVLDEYRHTSSNGKSTILGVNMRTFDPESGVWMNRWFDALNRTWIEFEARPTDFGIEAVYESRDAVGEHLVRIRFLDIEKDRFEWRADRSRDGGKTWEEKVMRIRATRDKDSTDSGPTRQ